MFVQRSEFNSGKRIALYKNYLLLLLFGGRRSMADVTGEETAVLVGLVLILSESGRKNESCDNINIRQNNNYTDDAKKNTL